ncbi:hypothetical protein C5O72_03220 [Muribaculum intestinale]|uniref:Uncharacterized protein n=1 Tax=Muribaculum intestinale TaxID=1796646 RepID=A0A1B1S8D4_9BACT|nr:hypothetical protein A4V02_04595 [Muribaculum intestinale]ASB38861.1 hypothetical protein ADH68_13175 [Muribaculum intestinale]PWB05040.1 hypothetical protein C5O29_02255 [Muribaculum intestinale]PWB11473.1 hypothetical protein C5O72_03220 [Muribaculum intestinale]
MGTTTRLMRADIQADSTKFRFTAPSGTTSKNYKIKKIAENQIFQRFFFCTFPSKIGKILKSAEYNSGTVKIKSVLFTRTAVTH